MNSPSINKWTCVWSTINIVSNILILYYLVSDIKPLINIILLSVIILSTSIHFITFLFHAITTFNNRHIYKRYLLNVIIDISILYVLIFMVSREDIMKPFNISLYVFKLTWIAIYLVPVKYETENTHDETISNSDDLSEVLLDSQDGTAKKELIN